MWNSNFSVHGVLLAHHLAHLLMYCLWLLTYTATELCSCNTDCMCHFHFFVLWLSTIQVTVTSHNSIAIQVPQVLLHQNTLIFLLQVTYSSCPNKKGNTDFQCHTCKAHWNWNICNWIRWQSLLLNMQWQDSYAKRIQYVSTLADYPLVTNILNSQYSNGEKN